MNRNLISFKLGYSDDGKEINVILGDYGVSGVLIEGTKEDNKNLIVSNLLNELSLYSEEYSQTCYYGNRDISVLTSTYTSRIVKVHDDVSEINLVHDIRCEINNRLRLIRRVYGYSGDNFGIDWYNTVSDTKLVRKVYVIEHNNLDCDYSLKRELEKLMVGELAVSGSSVGVFVIIITSSGNNYLSFETIRSFKCNIFLNVTSEDDDNKYAAVCFNRKGHNYVKLPNTGKNLL